MVRIILLGLLLIATAVASADELTGRVSWVYDGDTLQVEGLGRVRLLGIDTPEHKASDRDRFYTDRFQLSPERLRSISRQARDFNIRLVKNQRVALKFDKTQQDRHGRLLAYVYLEDGTMLNLLLLRQGLASVFRRYDFVYRKEFLAAEQTARSSRLGLWE